MNKHKSFGFTLTELAVVLTIVALLLGSLMYTFSAQTEQRTRAETQRRLDEIKELLIGFAIVNGRLPCPARNAPTVAPMTTAGEEVWEGAASGECRGDGVLDYLGGTISIAPPIVGGFVSGRAIGFRPVDDSGFALDAWGNRIRYAVSRSVGNPPGGTGCTVPQAPGFTSALNLKGNTISCAPRDIVICSTAAGANSGVSPPSCAAGASVTNQSTVVAVVYSTGKNTAFPCAGCVDEGENTDGDGVFVWHDVRPTGAVGGEFDDMLVWIPASQLYGKMIAAGRLP